MKSHLQADTRHLSPGASGDDQAQLQALPTHAPGEPRLPPARGGERIVFGAVNGYITGSRSPIVLVHSINAAPSAAEIRPIIEHYGATHTVFAIDLPRFGLSERSDRRHDPRLMTAALHALAEPVRNRCGAVPTDARASSLGCEFLAHAAVEQPTRWGRLAFVSPTGLNGTKPPQGPPGSARSMPWLHALLCARRAATIPSRSIQ